MTPRERWKAVLEGRRPDRPVCDYWGTAEVTDRLRRDRIGVTGRYCCGDEGRGSK
jgi:hypothetical protein